jgi:hypothetical protein
MTPGYAFWLIVVMGVFAVIGIVIHLIARNDIDNLED